MTAEFPRIELSQLGGGREALPDLWRDLSGPTLVMIGHSDCETTRLLLPYVNRIHARRSSGGLVVAVLQDQQAAAQAVVDDLNLDLPVYLEDDPYPLAQRLGLMTVPTLLLVSPAGGILRLSEAFRRDDVEALASSVGVQLPLFEPEDRAPALRPG